MATVVPVPVVAVVSPLSPTTVAAVTAVTTSAPLVVIASVVVAVVAAIAALVVARVLLLLLAGIVLRLRGGWALAPLAFSTLGVLVFSALAPVVPVAALLSLLFSLLCRLIAGYSAATFAGVLDGCHEVSFAQFRRSLEPLGRCNLPQLGQLEGGQPIGLTPLDDVGQAHESPFRRTAPFADTGRDYWPVHLTRCAEICIDFGRRHTPAQVAATQQMRQAGNNPELFLSIKRNCPRTIPQIWQTPTVWGRPGNRGGGAAAAGPITTRPTKRRWRLTAPHPWNPPGPRLIARCPRSSCKCNTRRSLTHF